MAAKKFIIELDAYERARLYALISKGKAPAKTILNPRIPLLADSTAGGPGWLDAQIVEAFDTNLTMVSRVREKLVTEGLDAVLTRKKRETLSVPAIFDSEAQAKLTALACSASPKGKCPEPSRCGLRTSSSAKRRDCSLQYSGPRIQKQRSQTAPDR